MAPTILYTACVGGAIALYLLLRPAPASIRVVAVLLGLAAIGWVVKEAARAGEPGEAPALFFYLFGLIAVASAVRMITHHRPVYAALYFVMVVLSSAGLFLLLEAEFMAFALVIVYAGAILITYLFVLMLARQVESPGEQMTQPEYDRLPREPAAAVVVGFMLLAVLGDMVLGGVGELPPSPSEHQQRLAAVERLNMLPDRVETAVRAELGRQTEAFVLVDGDGRRVHLAGETAYVNVDGPGGIQQVTLPDDALPENIEVVGLALISDFPVSLELAGVILLMAMFGAVVLAQRQIERSDQEKQAAANAEANAARERGR